MRGQKFSEGPWRIDGEFDADVSVTILDAAGVEVFEFYPAGHEWTVKEIANVRLIARAPTMFVSLDHISMLMGVVSGVLDEACA